MLKIKILFLTIILSCSVFAAEKKAVFAGGCFWCMEPPYEKTDGVLSVESGYIGGKKANPTYQEVSGGKSGHIEAVEVTYDDTKVSYDKLLTIFWRNIDPFDSAGQFCDKGPQYLSGIYYSNEEEEKLAQKSLAKVMEKFSDKKVATFVKKASAFYSAEDYHQDYYKKNPIRYKFYRFNCGRDKRLESVWVK